MYRKWVEPIQASVNLGSRETYNIPHHGLSRCSEVTRVEIPPTKIPGSQKCEIFSMSVKLGI